MAKRFEPRIPGPLPMPHLERRTTAVQALGWSRADAHWLALVCLHSGVFTRLQYREWHHRDKYTARRFVQRLTAAGVARDHPLPERRTPQRFCHVFGRSLYRALGIEHARQRRLGSTSLLWRRLLALDCLLAYPDANWLATGAEKLRFFFERGYDEEELPQRLLGNGAFDHVTLSPIAGGEDRVSFVFPDPGRRPSTRCATPSITSTVGVARTPWRAPKRTSLAIAPTWRRRSCGPGSSTKPVRAS